MARVVAGAASASKFPLGWMQFCIKTWKCHLHAANQSVPRRMSDYQGPEVLVLQLQPTREEVSGA
jgi:hypothetical protein